MTQPRQPLGRANSRDRDLADRLADRQARPGHPIPPERICGCTWSLSPVNRIADPFCPVHQGS